MRTQYRQHRSHGTRRDKAHCGKNGGDEFILLLSNIKQVQHVAIVAQRILNGLSQPFMVGTQEIYTSCQHRHHHLPHR